MNDGDRVIANVDGTDVECTLLGLFSEDNGTTWLAELETDAPAEDGFTAQYRPAAEIRLAA
jgi:hypothetical protein